MKIKDANGVEGKLTYVHGMKQYMFRVYEDCGKFKDYDLMHCDLTVKIVDTDAAFYENNDGSLVLDHSPETLGIKGI